MNTTLTNKQLLEYARTLNPEEIIDVLDCFT